MGEDLLKVFHLEETTKYLLPIFGSHMGHCNNPAALRVMASKAVQVYGSVESWRPSLVRGLGLIPTGLPPSTISRLTAEQMAALHPAAAAQLSPLVAHGDGHDHSHENSGEGGGDTEEEPKDRPLSSGAAKTQFLLFTISLTFIIISTEC